MNGIKHGSSASKLETRLCLIVLSEKVFIFDHQFNKNQKFGIEKLDQF